jgi:hypothetical protein
MYTGSNLPTYLNGYERFDSTEFLFFLYEIGNICFESSAISNLNANPPSYWKVFPRRLPGTRTEELEIEGLNRDSTLFKTEKIKA